MELTLIETKFFFYQGLYYIVKGQSLIQFDHDHWLDIRPGGELYGSLMRRFRKMVPIEESRGKLVLIKLSETIKNFID